MKSMNTPLAHLAAAVLLASAACAFADDTKRVLADFEGSADGDVIAPGPSSTSHPWRRFGEATSDNILATTSDAISGKVSATYPLGWPNKFGAARMVADSPIDLSKAASLSITAKTDQKTTKTVLFFQVSDGKTTYQTKTSQPLTSKANVLSVDLTTANWELVDGPRRPLKELLAEVAEIGFKVASDGSTYSENVVFDDLTVNLK